MAYFDPKTKKYPYPEDTASHYLEVNMDRGIVFDENYPFVNRKKSFRFVQFLIRIVLFIIVYPVAHIRFGLRIKGRRNLRKNRKILKRGFISASNHINLWDYLFVKCALKRYITNVAVWDKNINGKDGKLMRGVGAIPIPNAKDVKANLAFLKAIHGVFERGQVMQIYPEGSMWEYYAPIRPFKPGVGYFAIKEDRPVLPIGFSYRKPNWLRKMFGQIATITLNIGEPLYVNKELDVKSAEEDLLTRLHASICKLSYIRPEENLYPAIYKDSKRVDYY